jgi:hypothetical protein
MPLLRDEGPRLLGPVPLFHADGLAIEYSAAVRITDALENPLEYTVAHQYALDRVERDFDADANGLCDVDSLGDAHTVVDVLGDRHANTVAQCDSVIYFVDNIYAECDGINNHLGLSNVVEDNNKVAYYVESSHAVTFTMARALFIHSELCPLFKSQNQLSPKRRCFQFFQ